VAKIVNTVQKANREHEEEIISNRAINCIELAVPFALFMMVRFSKDQQFLRLSLLIILDQRARGL
jgi:hypothetical protein